MLASEAPRPHSPLASKGLLYEALSPRRISCTFRAMRDKAESPEELIARVGRRIRELRIRAKVTQSHVAKILKTRVSNYPRIENGRQNLTLETLALIALAL